MGYLVGQGHRAKFGIGSVLTAVYDSKEDNFKTIAKIGSGLTEEEWIDLFAMLGKIKTKEKDKQIISEIEPDVWVYPKYVVEVQADEITRSPVHTCGKEGDGSGYALRFPRIVTFIRRDKDPKTPLQSRKL